MPINAIPQMPGIVRDESPTLAKPRWVDGDRVRFVNGLPELCGGFESVVLEAFGGLCRGLHAWQMAGGAWAIAIGTHTHLYVCTGGEIYDITPTGLAAGLADGTGGLGFGTGAFGVGAFGVGSAVDYRPRFWTFGTFGSDLIAAPLNGTIYRWTGNVAQPAAPLSGAPARVDTVFVDPVGIVVACGANEQISGTYNPLLVRNSDIEAITDWTASLADMAGEFPLRVGSRLVRGLPARGVNLLWTDVALVAMTFTGDPGSVYRFDVLGQGCGLIGPNAAVVTSSGAYWMGANGQFYMWTGGAPQPMACPVRRWVMDSLSYVQADKVVAFSNAAHNEVGWIYPDARDGNECSRMVLLNTLDGSWSTHTTDRTCRIDAGVLPSPVSATTAGRLYFEERGHSADGGALSWSLTGSPVEIGAGDTLLEIQEIRPDFQRLVGGADIYLDVRAYPQSAPQAHGPWTATSATETLYPLVTGRQAAIRLQGNSAPADMRLGQLLLDVIDTGDRV